jgi:hypothetical protein
MGPFYVEGEVVYITGKAKSFESGAGGVDIDRSGWSAYVTGTFDFAPMYAGATFVWVQGDDKSSTDKIESGASGGADFNPCLMLFNYDLGRWEGSMGSGTGAASSITTASAGINNALIAQVFFGIKPIPKLDVRASYTIAQADRDVTAANWQSKDYGSELDITATYKIYDNLSYMVGFAYLWAGDYWKGTNSGASVDNDYLVTHKLTLAF